MYKAFAALERSIKLSLEKAYMAVGEIEGTETDNDMDVN